MQKINEKYSTIILVTKDNEEKETYRNINLKTSNC